MHLNRSIQATVLTLVAASVLTFAGCGSEEKLDRQATGDVTEMNGAFWAAYVPAAGSTLGITEMTGALWAAYVPAAGSTLGITEMNGAFWSAYVAPVS